MAPVKHEIYQTNPLSTLTSKRTCTTHKNRRHRARTRVQTQKAGPRSSRRGEKGEKGEKGDILLWAENARVLHPRYCEGGGRMNAAARKTPLNPPLRKGGSRSCGCENPFSRLRSRESLPANLRPLPNRRSSDMLTPCRRSNDTFSFASMNAPRITFAAVARRRTLAPFAKR